MKRTQRNWFPSCYLPSPIFVFFFKTPWVTLNSVCLLCILPSPRAISLGFGPKYNHTPTYQVEAEKGLKDKKKHKSCLTRRPGCINQVLF